MKRAPRSLQHHVLYRKYNGQDSEISALLGKCGLYVDPGAIAAHAGEIASLKLKATKTGVTFSLSNPITDELVEKLAVSSRRKKGF